MVPGTARFILFLLTIALAMALPRVGSAQEPWLPSASAPWDGHPQWLTGHAWFAAPFGQEPDGKPLFALMHVPPRDAERNNAPGTLRRAARLASLPDGLAAWGSEVWLVFPVEFADGQPRRRVSQLTLAPAGVGGEFLVSGGLETNPSLPLGGVLLASAGTPVGPLVLLRDDAGVLQIHVLCSSGWRPLRLPDGLAQGLGRFAALPTRDGPLVTWISRAGQCTWALGSLKDSPAGLSVDWKLTSFPDALPEIQHPDPRPAVTAPKDQQAFWADGQFLWLQRQDGPLATLLGVRPEGATKLASFDLPRPAAVVALDGIGRLALISEDPALSIDTPAAEPSGRTSARATHYALTEISAFDGALLHTGASSSKLFAPWQLQFLTVTFSVLILGVLLFVLRSESETPLPLPPGFALAPPARRLAAAAIDILPPALIASAIHNIPPLAVLAIPISARSAQEWVPLATMLFLTLAASTLAEWQSGRTIGKRVMGLGVLGYRPAGGHASSARDGQTFGRVAVGLPTLQQAVLRNAFRWIAWPLTILMLLDANRRHPGDVLAKTLVVHRLEDDIEE